MSNMIKQQPKVDIRTPYYKASDGIYALFDRLRTSEAIDKDVKDQAAQLVIELNKLEEMLSKKYIWD